MSNAFCFCSGVAAAALGLTGVMVTYQIADALEDDAGSRFRRGDEVRFKARRLVFTIIILFLT